jgi:hypothetical protein
MLNFAFWAFCEVRRIHLLRTRVNKAEAYTGKELLGSLVQTQRA